MPKQEASNATNGALPIRRVRKSGSETRKKQRLFTFRMTSNEFAMLQVAADRAGVTLGTYVRDCILTAPETRRRPRPTVEVQAVTKLQGQMNKVGSNIHQILRRVNFGETPIAEEFREALAGYRQVITSILQVLGRGPQ
jgi:hypothetical protein